MAVDETRAKEAVRAFLVAIGEDPDRPGLVETPNRVARAAREILGGYDENPAEHLRKQFQESDNEEMVIVRDPVLLVLRAPYPAVHRACARRLYLAGWSDHRSVEDRTMRERLCPPPAAAGASDRRDRRCPDGRARPPGRARCVGGGAYVHDDAGRSKRRCDYNDVCCAGHLPHGHQDARGGAPPARLVEGGPAGDWKRWETRRVGGFPCAIASMS